MLAGRYLLRHDMSAQSELDRIAEGEGIADLIQDLRDLKTFTAAHAKTFAFDRRLPKDLATQLGALADELRAAGPADYAGLQAARNLAAAGLETMFVELRAGARYLFADKPRALGPFLSQHEAQKKGRARRSAKALRPPKVPAGSPDAAG